MISIVNKLCNIEHVECNVNNMLQILMMMVSQGLELELSIHSHSMRSFGCRCDINLSENDT